MSLPETGELYVSYQALDSPYKFYIKPLKLFAAKVEDGRTDNLLHQKYKLNYTVAISTENYDRLSELVFSFINRILNIQ